MSRLFDLFEALVAKHPEETCRVIHSIDSLQKVFIRIQAQCWYYDLSGVTDAHMRVTFVYNSNSSDIYKKTLEENLPDIHSAFNEDPISNPWWGACLLQLNQCISTIETGSNSLACMYTRSVEFSQIEMPDSWKTIFKAKRHPDSSETLVLPYSVERPPPGREGCLTSPARPDPAAGYFPATGSPSAPAFAFNS